MNNISMLDKRYMMPVILFVHRNPKCIKTELYNATSRSAHMPDRLDELESLGLLTQTRAGLTGMTILELTSKGERIAECLEFISDVMKEDSGNDGSPDEQKAES